MPFCASCRRPVALARATCLYCGAPLAAEDVAAALAAATQAAAQAFPGSPAAERPARALLVLDLADANPDTLAATLALPRYEAGQLARRGGLHLHRVMEEADAREEARRLGERGLDVLLVPEAQARARPLRAFAGRREGDRLELRTEQGDLLAVPPEALLLVVSGPIVREYQSRFERRRVDTARREEGRRVHLHRAREARPIEIDPDNFDAGARGAGSARLEVDAWLAVLRGVRHDEGFRRLPPALSPAEPETDGPLAAAASLRARRASPSGLVGPPRAGDEPVLLDNVRQFRFYSAWRGAVERQRAEPSRAADGA